MWQETVASQLLFLSQEGLLYQQVPKKKNQTTGIGLEDFCIYDRG